MKKATPRHRTHPTSVQSDIGKRILKSARLRIDRFELEVLHILFHELDLLACSFYSLSPFAKRLSLRGQVGLSYQTYESFSLGLGAMAGRAFKRRRAQSFTKLGSRRDYRDKSLIEIFGFRPYNRVKEARTRLVCRLLAL